MDTNAFHRTLRLKNFTVFADAAFEFVPGINVLIGENGSGKTHVLKALYAWQMARHLADPGRPAKYDTLFEEVFRIDSVKELQRSRRSGAQIAGEFDGAWSLRLQEKNVVDAGSRPQPPRPVFIPSIEMMMLARNMDGILRDYADFDRTCFDYISLVAAKEATGLNGHRLTPNESLRNLLPGFVEWDSSAKRFFFVTDKIRRPFQVLAEGERKIAGLLRLIDLGFIAPGTVLLWDEPEVNLNPKWMDELVEQIVAIAGFGTQVFLATHSYVILKQIDLFLRSAKVRGKEQPTARYFVLRKSRGVTAVNEAGSLSSLDNNPIIEQYNEMLFRDMDLDDEEA